MTEGGDRFPNTVWARIRDAASQKATAVTDFVHAYREPLHRFLASHGIPENEAEDVLQEIFLKLFEKRLLDAADANRGRFRNYLLGITKNVLGNRYKRVHTARRTAGGPVLSLDAPVRGEDDSLADQIAAHDDASFDSLWTENLAARAMDRLRQDCEQRELPYFRALSEFLNNDATYASIAQKMGVSEAQVRNYIHRGKRKLIDFIRDDVASYCSTAEEFREELRHLSRFFETSG